MKKTFYTALFSIIFHLSPWCQAPFFKMHPLGEEYPKVKVERMFQDRESLLWFGTTEGLFQFDGKEFKIFPKQDTTSKRVSAIYQDKESCLWIGYYDGSIYQLKKDRLVRWNPEEGTPSVPIVGFAEDNRGNFWFATYGEGVYYQREGRIYNINHEEGLPFADVYVMAKDSQGRMWLGTDGGISVCSVDEEGKKLVENISLMHGLPDNIVREILPDDKGNFWIGMYDKGFCYYDVQNKTFHRPVEDWQHGPVSHLEIFKGRELWAGTEGDGIWRYSFFDQSVHQVDAGRDFQSSKIYDLHKDIEGNIWVISNTHGICHANRQFEFVNTPFENVQALLSDLKSNLWVGTDKGVFTQHLDEHGNSFFRQHLGHVPLNVISLYEDKFQNIWIGTFGEGVYLLKPATGQVRHLTGRDGLPNGSILSMAGVNEKVWLATLGGAVEFEIKKDPLLVKEIPHRALNREDGLGANFIYKVFIDSKGRTWFGTDGSGISVLDNGNITNYTHARHRHPSEAPANERTDAKGRPTNRGHLLTANLEKMEDVPLKAIYSITEDRMGNIWLSTAKEGIFRFDGKNFHHLTVKEGIRNLAITSLITTEKGEILIVHPTGIDLLTPETGHLIYYDQEVGIKNMEPNLNAVCSDRQGNIWIGSQRSIIRYTPLREKLSIHPRTLLTSISVFLENIDFKNKTTFAPDENNLVFNYTGLWYTDPGTVQYRYQLEGFNTDWVTSHDLTATYPNLPPGNYVFKVSSTENDAFADEPVVSFAFEVQAPLWKRPWFIALCLALAGGVLYLFIKARDQRIQREAVLKKEKIESQFEALKAQINPHFLFNSFNTLISIIEEDQDVAVKYVEHLSDFYRSILQYREKEVISVEEECRVVESYTYLLKHRYGDNLQLNIQLDPETHHTFIAPLTLQMLVENAVKHNVISKTKPLVIDILPNGGEYLIVQNSLQPKMDQLKSTRFGLQNIVTRYELLSNKKVKIEKTEDHFKVWIPVIKEV